MADDEPRGVLDALAKLTLPQKAMLGLLGAIENKVSMHGTAIKLFNDVVQRGRTEPITEKDLSEEERKQFLDLVKGHSSKTGKSEGKIDYPDYPVTMDQNILGGFQYAVDPSGAVDISDVYNFNRNRAGSYEDNVFAQALALLANPRGLAATIGRKVVPDDRGIPVKMRLE